MGTVISVKKWNEFNVREIILKVNHVQTLKKLFAYSK